MKKAKEDALFIMTVTEHKCMATIDNYAPLPELDERIDASLAIMSVNPQKPQVGSRKALLQQAADQGDYFDIFHPKKSKAIFN